MRLLQISPSGSAAKVTPAADAVAAAGGVAEAVGEAAAVEAAQAAVDQESADCIASGVNALHDSSQSCTTSSDLMF